MTYISKSSKPKKEKAKRSSRLKISCTTSLLP